MDHPSKFNLHMRVYSLINSDALGIAQCLLQQINDCRGIPDAVHKHFVIIFKTEVGAA